jgi:hypothetical protein
MPVDVVVATIIILVHSVQNFKIRDIINPTRHDFIKLVAYELQFDLACTAEHSAHYFLFSRTYFRHCSY